MLACGAKRQKAEYIVTRNEKDFRQSPVTAITPAKFLEKFYLQQRQRIYVNVYTVGRNAQFIQSGEGVIENRGDRDIRTAFQ